MSWDINTVILVGRLTRDPESSITQNQKELTKFSIANGRGQNDTSFFEIVSWSQTANFCKQYLRKGSQVVVEGRLKQDRFTDKTTGQNRAKIVVVANNVQSVGSKQEQQNSQYGNQNNQQVNFPDNFVGDDDIP